MMWEDRSRFGRESMPCDRLEQQCWKVMKIQKPRGSYRCSLFSKRLHCKAATCPHRAVQKGGQSLNCKVGRAGVGNHWFTHRFGQVRALSSRGTEHQGIVDGLSRTICAKQWRSSRIQRHRTKATEHSRIEFSMKFACLFGKWFLSYNDNHLTEMPQSENETANEHAWAAADSYIGIPYCYQQRVGWAVSLGGSNPKSCHWLTVDFPEVTKMCVINVERFLSQRFYSRMSQEQEKLFERRQQQKQEVLKRNRWDGRWVRWRRAHKQF